MTVRQLHFDLPRHEARGHADFFVAPPNEAAFRTVENWRDWPLGKLILIGPQGAGKSHLVHVWSALTNATVIAAADLGTADLAARGADSAVAVEDADRPAALNEPALLHLHNILAERGAPLLVTARDPVRSWNLSLPDLRSRLEAASVARLAGPDDALLRAVLLKQFADRQVAVSPELVSYLMARMERSFAAAQRLVDALDSAALSERVPVSRALAARVLDKAAKGGA